VTDNPDLDAVAQACAEVRQQRGLRPFNNAGPLPTDADYRAASILLTVENATDR
jgi:hypothetical protein